MPSIESRVEYSGSKGVGAGDASSLRPPLKLMTTGPAGGGTANVIGVRMGTVKKALELHQISAPTESNIVRFVRKALTVVMGIAGMVV